MKHRSILNPLIAAGGMAILSLPLVLFGGMVRQRPPQTSEARSLFQGIRYQREFHSTPRPVMLHIVTLDLTAPGVKAFVTPGNPTADHTETNARTTSEFLKEFKLQVAINANFFYPFAEDTPWNFYPHSGDRVNAVGQAISNAKTYSPADPRWAALCFSAAQRATIVATGQCPNGTLQAVAGSTLVVSGGKLVTQQAGTADSDGIYSRTAVGVDQAGTTLWLFAVDDKQWRYSEGVTLVELGELALQYGADTVLNLDGGGSTTLVVETPAGTKVLNSPVHTKIPMRERPVANHLGFYAHPQ